MVYVKEDRTEEVTAVYSETRNGTSGVTVETEDGYFEYWFPIRDAEEYIDAEKHLDAIRMEIYEAKGEPNESLYTGKSHLIVPQVVAEAAEDYTGYPVPE